MSPVACVCVEGASSGSGYHFCEFQNHFLISFNECLLLNDVGKVDFGSLQEWAYIARKRVSLQL